MGLQKGTREQEAVLKDLLEALLAVMPFVRGELEGSSDWMLVTKCTDAIEKAKKFLEKEQGDAYVKSVEYYDQHRIDSMTARQKGECGVSSLGWYWWDETWANVYGPFRTEEEAVKAQRKYCEAMEIRYL